MIEALVCRLMEKHDQNARRSLAAVATVSAIQQDLETVGDDDLTETLGDLVNAAECGEETPDTTTAETTQRLRSGGPRFRPMNFHARGGLGEVWVATDVELNREVALKQIQETYADDPQSQARFLQEAEVTGRLEHRGIVPVYSLGRFENGRPFYAMRFVSGTSLKEAIAEFHQAESQSPPAPTFVELRRLLGRFVDVCNTVAYATVAACSTAT